MIAAGFVLLILVLAAALTLPPRLVDLVHPGIRDLDHRLAEENALRTALVGILAGGAVIAGAIVGALNYREATRHNRAVVDLQRKGQLADRFTRAIEQLGHSGNDNLDTRIGAVYALEQIASDSIELHWPVMEVLTTYLRQHASGAKASLEADGANAKAGDEPIVPADIQAIATVLGRRTQERDPPGHRLVLRRIDLRGIYWSQARLKGAVLEAAQLQEAYLDGAQLEGADLRGAQLQGASLRPAVLIPPGVSGFHDWPGVTWDEPLGGLFLPGPKKLPTQTANLRGALLHGAQMTSAQLYRANLSKSFLSNAVLRKADLADANLRGADLKNADLTDAEGLTWDQIQARRCQTARLPTSAAALGHRGSSARSGSRFGSAPVESRYR